MTSILKVDTIQDQAGNNIINESSDTITIGASGDTITIVFIADIIDVTDTANVKVKFNVSTENANFRLLGATDNNATSFTFIRLGDT
jgi:hypothetical protein